MTEPAIAVQSVGFGNVAWRGFRRVWSNLVAVQVRDGDDGEGQIHLRPFQAPPSPFVITHHVE